MDKITQRIASHYLNLKARCVRRYVGRDGRATHWHPGDDDNYHWLKAWTKERYDVPTKFKSEVRTSSMFTSIYQRKHRKYIIVPWQHYHCGDK